MAECGAERDAKQQSKGVRRHATPRQAAAEMREMALTRGADMEGQAAAALAKDISDGLALRDAEAAESAKAVAAQVKQFAAKQQAQEAARQAALDQFHAEALKAAEAEESKFDAEAGIIRKAVNQAADDAAAGGSNATVVEKRDKSPRFDMQAVIKTVDASVAPASPFPPPAGSSKVLPASMIQLGQRVGQRAAQRVGQRAALRAALRAAQRGTPVISPTASASLREAVMAAVTKEHGGKSEAAHSKGAAHDDDSSKPAPAAHVLHQLRHGDIVAPAYADQRQGRHSGRAEGRGDDENNEDDQEAEDEEEEREERRAKHHQHHHHRLGSDHRFRAMERAGREFHLPVA